MLGLIGPWILVIAVTLVLFTLGMRRSLGRAMESIAARHRAAETVLNDGQVPASWVERDRRNLQAARRKGASAEAIEKIGQRGHKRAMKELGRLERYMRTSRLVEDEDSRALILESIERRRDEWAAAGWQEILHGGPSVIAERPD